MPYKLDRKLDIILSLKDIQCTVPCPILLITKLSKQLGIREEELHKKSTLFSLKSVRLLTCDLVWTGHIFKWV